PGAFRSPGTAPAPCKAHLHGTGSHAVGRWSKTVGVAAMGVWGEPQTPIAATPTVFDHLPTAWLPVPCKWALQGAGAVPGDL
ncbi:hypothetical protein NXZ11_25855, partial [Escherichia coli]|nr:hypothetical protein [Escherichia coli]